MTVASVAALRWFCGGAMAVTPPSRPVDRLYSPSEGVEETDGGIELVLVW
ncbi:hypothetical protein HanIR_Chr11g0539881 [Helianthus annuus]|nr:hypothetical protein HanIR_Chr11g0539881 [Helianthus annuus]